MIRSLAIALIFMTPSVWAGWTFSQYEKYAHLRYDQVTQETNELVKNFEAALESVHLEYVETIKNIKGSGDDSADAMNAKVVEAMQRRDSRNAEMRKGYDDSMAEVLASYYRDMDNACVQYSGKTCAWKSKTHQHPDWIQ